MGILWMRILVDGNFRKKVVSCGLSNVAHVAHVNIINSVGRKVPWSPVIRRTWDWPGTDNYKQLVTNVFNIPRRSNVRNPFSPSIDGSFETRFLFRIISQNVSSYRWTKLCWKVACKSNRSRVCVYEYVFRLVEKTYSDKGFSAEHPYGQTSLRAWKPDFRFVDITALRNRL